MNELWALPALIFGLAVNTLYRYLDKEPTLPLWCLALGFFSGMGVAVVLNHFGALVKF